MQAKQPGGRRRESQRMKRCALYKETAAGEEGVLVKKVLLKLNPLHLSDPLLFQTLPFPKI